MNMMLSFGSVCTEHNGFEERIITGPYVEGLVIRYGSMEEVLYSNITGFTQVLVPAEICINQSLGK